jgi:hypothetical protein
MSKRRATIISTGDPMLFKAELEIPVSAKTIFDFIAVPANHSLMDGSKMVKGTLSGPVRLHLGAKFGMKMRQGIPYVIKNEVVEFEEGRSIGWRHLLHNVWRYELQPLDSNRTLVIESWDGRNARAKSWLRFRKFDKWVPIAMAKTLVQLEELLIKEI